MSTQSRRAGLRTHAAIVAAASVTTAVLGVGMGAAPASAAQAATPRAVTSPQAAAAKWTYVEDWDRKWDCVNDGQQYEREGWKYSCRYEYNYRVDAFMWDLYIS